MTATCEAWECTPGELSCRDGDTLERCLADGLSVETTDCTADGRVCASGACRMPQCAPSQDYCDGQVVRRCSADGASSTQRLVCGAGQYCDPASATCVTGACAAGQPGCDGTIATVCTELGDGFEPDGVDCSVDGQACIDGECLEVLCTAGATRCMGGDGERCNAQGTAWLVEQPCSTTQFCQEGDCRPQVCQPGASLCSGNELRLCNAEGSGSALQQTCGSTQRCDPVLRDCLEQPDGGAPQCMPASCPECGPTSNPCCTAARSCGCDVFFLGICQ